MSIRTYGEMSAALIHGLRTGRIFATRSQNGELLFHGSNAGEDVQRQAIDTDTAIREIEANSAVQADICVN
jgi:hypothetical protein